MSVPLIATDAYPYAGRSLVKGEAFEASEQDANTLKLIGRAVDAPKVVRQSRLLQTRDLALEDEAGDVEAPKPKRQYRRRDLIPEP